ncbi:MAG: hypothetical protein ACRD0K_05630 [Egibacteraceae bacterium]
MGGDRHVAPLPLGSPPRRFHPARRGRGFSVALIDVDGAGKSTAAEALRASFGDHAICVYMGCVRRAYPRCADDLVQLVRRRAAVSASSAPIFIVSATPDLLT